MFSRRPKTTCIFDCVGLLWLAVIAFSTVLITPAVSSASDLIVISINLNLEAKGDFFVLPTTDDDFLIRVEDLKSMGFRDPTGLQSIIANSRQAKHRFFLPETGHFLLSGGVERLPELSPQPCKAILG